MLGIYGSIKNYSSEVHGTDGVCIRGFVALPLASLAPIAINKSTNAVRELRARSVSFFGMLGGDWCTSAFFFKKKYYLHLQRHAYVYTHTHIQEGWLAAQVAQLCCARCLLASSPSKVVVSAVALHCWACNQFAHCLLHARWYQPCQGVAVKKERRQV